MKRISIGLALIAGLASPALGKGKDVKFVTSDVVKDKPVVILDPTRAYILLRSDAAMPLHLMKMPSAEDQSAYDALRAEELASERKKYVKHRARYEQEMATYKRLPKGHSIKMPVEPIEPTETNFEFVPFNLLSGVSIGPMNRFSKQDGGASTYLQAVTPGRYRI